MIATRMVRGGKVWRNRELKKKVMVKDMDILRTLTTWQRPPHDCAIGDLLGNLEQVAWNSPHGSRGIASNQSEFYHFRPESFNVVVVIYNRKMDRKNTGRRSVTLNAYGGPLPLKRGSPRSMKDHKRNGLDKEEKDSAMQRSTCNN